MTQVEKRRRNAKGEGERLREEIVAAAMALINEIGQEALTLRSVARAAGVTAPAIYAHFDDLDELRRAVVASTFEDFSAFLRGSVRGKGDEVARLHTLCWAYIQFGLERPREYAVMFGPASKAHSRAIEKPIDTMPGSEAFAILLVAINDCIAAGRSDSTSAVDDATAVWVALHGYVGLRAAAPDFPWPAGHELLDELVNRLARLRA